MEHKEIQDNVEKIFKKNFGYTPLGERLEDIKREFFELNKWQDIKNLKEETGDLLSTLIQLCNESGWDLNEVIQNTLNKIESRYDQYKTLGRKVKIAILGGAFDPITLGHIQLAQFVLNSSGEFDEVWLMPAYSHMYNKQMVHPTHRLMMCEIAARVDGRIKVFDYEILKELKGETYFFFKKLKEEKDLNDKFNFSMIIGLDNANTFHKWVNYKELEKMARFVVVPRKGIKRDMNVDWYLKSPHIFLQGEHIIQTSSTEVREILKTRNEFFDSITKFVDPDVLKYIEENKLYI